MNPSPLRPLVVVVSLGHITVILILFPCIQDFVKLPYNAGMCVCVSVNDHVRECVRVSKSVLCEYEAMCVSVCESVCVCVCVCVCERSRSLAPLGFGA